MAVSSSIRIRDLLRLRHQLVQALPLGIQRLQARLIIRVLHGHVRNAFGAVGHPAHALHAVEERVQVFGRHAHAQTRCTRIAALHVAVFIEVFHIAAQAVQQRLNIFQTGLKGGGTQRQTGRAHQLLPGGRLRAAVHRSGSVCGSAALLDCIQVICGRIGRPRHHRVGRAGRGGGGAAGRFRFGHRVLFRGRGA